MIKMAIYIFQQLEILQLIQITTYIIKHNQIIMNSQSQKRSLSHPVSNFIEKLTQILENPLFANIIHWTQDQQAVFIKNIQQLSDIVLPAYFKHRNFSSFIRQLNIYGFTKIQHYEGEIIYANEFFKKNNRKQYKYIKRRVNTEQKQVLANQQDKSKQNLSIYIKQLSELHRKQKKIENVIRELIDENQKLRNQNVRLWKKIDNTMKKSDRKLEKLEMLALLNHQTIQNSNALKRIKIDQIQNCEFKELVQQQIQKPANIASIKSILSMLDSKKGEYKLKNIINYLYQQKIRSNDQHFQELRIRAQQDEEFHISMCLKQNVQNQQDNYQHCQQLQILKQQNIIFDITHFLK